MPDMICTLKGIKGDPEKKFFNVKKIRGLRDITGLTLVQCKTIVDALLKQDLLVEVTLPPYVTSLKEDLIKQGFEVFERPAFFFHNEYPNYVTIITKMPISIPDSYPIYTPLRGTK
jgi:hypothetical protein